MKKYEEIIHTHKKNIFIAYHQGKVFKRFKDKEKFIKLVNEFKVHKSTVIFKINMVNLIDKHPKLMKSSVTNHCKDIKQICKKIQTSLNR